MVPVASQVGRIAWHADHVPEAFGDVLIAARAHVGLASLIRLHTSNLDRAIQPVPHAHPRKAQAVIAAMINKAEPTMSTSLGRFTRLRIGLNPMASVLSRRWRHCRFLVRTVSSP